MSNAIKKSHSLGAFAPTAIGLSVTATILLLFNMQYFMGLLTYSFPPSDNPTRATNSSVVESSPSTDEIVRVTAEPRLIIPSINVDAPVVYGMPRTDEESVQRALQDGILHFAGTPAPGQNGNSVLVGHSSNAPWAPGDYKFVLAHLERIGVGDTYTVNYETIQYTYRITSVKVVLPSDVTVLAPTDTPTMTLITCTPVGTNLKRLVVLADQIDPKPLAGIPASSAPQASVLPGSQ